MKRLSLTVAFGITLSALMGTATQADPQGCKEAISIKLSALLRVQAASSRYDSCISHSIERRLPFHSDGEDDCSSEFSGLKSARDAFASASANEDKCLGWQWDPLYKPVHVSSSIIKRAALRL
jgi:hypothetical protein